jgi:putative phosphoribosyl transferase
MEFRDRREAGRVLAERLQHHAGRDNVMVLALPRGGVPVGYEVACALGVPLDVLLVRKLGVPGHEELAMGALASTGAMVLNQAIVDRLGVAQWQIDRAVQREQVELSRRERLYRGARPPPQLAGKTVILVDDGLATGATMRAAVEALRAEQPAKIVVAVPVAAPESCEEVMATADEVVCAAMPDPFFAVGAWYQDFTPTSDGEVVALLSGDTVGSRPSPTA